MVKSCCVKYCKSESYAGCGISFHKFPKDEDRKKKWLDIVPSSQKITKNSVVCSNHFKKEDFHEVCSRQLLKEHVIPSIFPLIIVTSRYGLMTGMVLGTFDVLMYSHAVGLGPILQRYARHVVPLALMGATFTLVSSGALKMREKDDPFNYFLGGLACGPLVAAYVRSKHGLVAGGLALGAIGFIKKDAVEQGCDFFPDFPDHFNTVNGWKNDWTMAEDPKNLLEHTCGKK